MEVLAVLYVLLIVLICIMLMRLTWKITHKHKRHRTRVPHKKSPPSSEDEYEYMADYMHIPNGHMYIVIPEHVVQAALQQKQQRRTHK